MAFYTQADCLRGRFSPLSQANVQGPRATLNTQMPISPIWSSVVRWLGYRNPIVSEAVLTTAIPAMPIVTMLALQYRVREAEAASAVFLSVICSLITMGCSSH